MSLRLTSNSGSEQGREWLQQSTQHASEMFGDGLSNGGKRKEMKYTSMKYPGFYNNQKFLSF